MSSPPPPSAFQYSNTSNAIRKRKWYKKLNKKFAELREVVKRVVPLKHGLCREEVLAAAVLHWIGTPCSVPSPEKQQQGENSDEYKTRVAKVRWAQQVASYRALREHIKNNGFGTVQQRSRLEKSVVLEILIEELKKKLRATDSNPPPRNPPMPLPASLFSHINMNNFLMAQNQLYLNSLLMNFPLIQPVNQNAPGSQDETEETVQPEEPEEIIDVEN